MRTPMKDARVVIAASVSKVAGNIQPMFDNINKLVDEFKEVRVILVESDSHDGTYQMIESMRDYLKCPLELYNVDGMTDPEHNDIRTARLATARNYYLDKVEESYGDYDYLYCMDFNYSNLDPIDLDAVRSNFELQEDWNVVTANQAGIYYDLWALRHKDWMPFNCWGEIWDRLSWMPEQERRNIILCTRKIVIPPETPPILTDSSWGGSAIIKIEAIKGARHTWFDEDGWVDVEIASLMKQIGKVYINPRFINWRTGPEQPDNPEIECSVSPIVGKV